MAALSIESFPLKEKNDRLQPKMQSVKETYSTVAICIRKLESTNKQHHDPQKTFSLPLTSLHIWHFSHPSQISHYNNNNNNPTDIMPPFTSPTRRKRLKDASTHPLPHQKTLHLLSQFYLSTMHSLLSFSNDCEEKLNKVSDRIGRLENDMVILEGRLRSIDGVNWDQMIDQKNQEAKNQQQQQGASGNAPPAPGAGGDSSSAPPPPPPPPGTAPPPPPPQEEQQPEPEPEPEVMKAKDDPRLAQYFKYLRLKIPKQAVGQKMQMIGYDPAWLDHPDSPTPLGEYVEEEQVAASESDSDDSSDDSD